jgi:hypothetical protein
MKRFCENGLCENEAAYEVEAATFDCRGRGHWRVRRFALCSACEAAYNIGRQAETAERAMVLRAMADDPSADALANHEAMEPATIRAALHELRAKE